MQYGNKIYLQNEIRVQKKYALNSFSFTYYFERFDRMKTHTPTHTLTHRTFTIYYRRSYSIYYDIIYDIYTYCYT